MGWLDPPEVPDYSDIVACPVCGRSYTGAERGLDEDHPELQLPLLPLCSEACQTRYCAKVAADEAALAADWREAEDLEEVLREIDRQDRAARRYEPTEADYVASDLAYDAAREARYSR